ncbi:uncharacterized protein LOC143299154 [Babylonia areolata]|uniref:uncharacterized protein LOC143299154 n=1 Tax=Babylonia areolata TaxID=304850 RepID=UPI003FD49FA2
MPSVNKRGSFGAESMTAPVTSPPTYSSRPPVTTGPRGRDDANHVTQTLDTPMDPQPEARDARDKTSLIPHEHDSDMSTEEFPPDDTLASGFKSQTSLHPGTVLARHKPSLKRLEDLPALSIVTWEEFLENPSVLCGLFEADRQEFIHYNEEQVNVFFHDPRMEQPALGAPSGDGLSWTIFIDNYSHLRSVRTWLSEKVSVILLHLVRSKGGGTAACLVAINPARKSVGGRLHDSFTRAVDAFLHQQNFSVEINLNDCVQKWCRTELRAACEVKGGRVVITNGEERVPCSRVDSLPFCLACFPVWAARKLSYKYKRQSEYEDIVLSFRPQDLSLCSEQSSANKATKSQESAAKPTEREKKQVWVKKPHSHTAGSEDKPDDRGNLEIKEVPVDSTDPGQQERRRAKRHSSKADKERGQDSGFSSDNASAAERAEPTLSKGLPRYRPNPHVPPRPSDKTKRVSRSRKTLDDASSTSASTSCASSTWDPTSKDVAAGKSVSSISWHVVQDVQVEEEEEEEGDGGDWMVPPSHEPSQDFRAAELADTLPVVQSEGEEGNYTLLEVSPVSSPRPDTPYHKSLGSTSQRGKRPNMVSQGAAISEEWLENGERMSSAGRVQFDKTTASSPRQMSEDVRMSKQQYVSHPRTEESLYAMDNEAFEYEDQAKLKGSKAFPYTSEYLDTMGPPPSRSPRYGLVDQDAARGDELRKKRTASAAGNEATDMLFAPRDHSRHKHNMHDSDADDMEDAEDDYVSVMSEEEETYSELGSATGTEQVTSSERNRTTNESRVRWQITDVDQDDDAESTGTPGPNGAQQLRSSKEYPAQGAHGEAWRRGGLQYDSKRRYIALNSLRRKSNKHVLQADLRKQKHSEETSPAH